MADWTKLNTAHDKGTLATLTVPATTIGNLLILAMSNSPGGSDTPSGGGTWARIGASQHGVTDNQDATWWWAVCTSSVTTITFTPGSVQGGAVCFVEFVPPTGVTPTLDASNTAKAFAATTTGANDLTTNAITPAADKELLLAAFYDGSGTGPTWTQGTGWSMGVAEPGGVGLDGSSFIEWKVGSTGAQSATATTNKTGNQYTGQIAVFTPAGSGGGGGGSTVSAVGGIPKPTRLVPTR